MLLWALLELHSLPRRRRGRSNGLGYQAYASLPATPALRREQIKLQVALITPLIHVKGYEVRLDCSLGECAVRQKWQQSECQNGRPSQDHLVRFDYVWASTEAEYTRAVWLPRAEVRFGSAAAKIIKSRRRSMSASPRSGHARLVLPCLLSANNGHIAGCVKDAATRNSCQLRTYRSLRAACQRPAQPAALMLETAGVCDPQNEPRGRAPTARFYGPYIVF